MSPSAPPAFKRRVRSPTERARRIRAALDPRERPEEGRAPSRLEILRARERAGMTQTRAAAVVYSTKRAWIRWESGERRMHPAFWDLFNRKVKPGARRKPRRPAREP